MENGGWIVILILVVLVGGVNLMALGAARGAFRRDDKTSMFNILNKTVNSVQKRDTDLEELRRTMQELEKGTKENNSKDAS